MQELRNLPDTRDIPIIIVSIIDDQDLGFSMGAVGYLIKPLDREQLNSKVKSIVQKGEDAKIHLLEAIRNIERFQKAGVA
jgi:PleD family two-component response regulator